MMTVDVCKHVFSRILRSVPYEAGLPAAPYFCSQTTSVLSHVHILSVFTCLEL